MVSARDVRAIDLINNVAEKLKDNIKMPKWAIAVKTGCSKERAPESHDWWYVRAASILRKIYLTGPVGISKLRTIYGSRKRRGHKPAHFKKASGKIIRTIVQDLEKLEYVEKDENRGRKITSKGQSFVDRTAKTV